MEDNKSLHGFRPLREQESPETGSTAVFYIHEQSGAQLVHLKNEDRHLAFCIGFRTPPEDSTGVAHIVEHSVLSGSRKFKTREPFMELLKGSMNTFLNAMTYPDMTVYPVSSMNAKDFRNLVDVYMDAVLFPGMAERKEIFMQEGWHHQILSEDEPVTYTGVVYNEMRGAYSSPESNVAVQVSRALNQGTTYDHESGGYPYDIPNLTYEQFLAFHQKYYHPSNSLIYLYGDVDLDELLGLLDKEYLSLFNRRERDSTLNISPQEPGIKRLEFQYPADSSRTEEDHSYLSYAVSLGQADDPEDYFVHTILNEILINSESSPLKKALNDAGLGEDVMGLSDDSYFLDFGLSVKYTSAQRLEEFVQLVEGTLRALVDQGIDEKLLLASLNRVEFQLREAGGTLKGIIHGLKAMAAWRYDAEIMQYLDFSAEFARLRRGMKEGLFEGVIRDRILNNPVKLYAVHRPQAGYFAQLDQALADKLTAFKESLSPEALAELIAENQALLTFQTTEDSREAKATIPHLELSDINPHITHIEEESSQCQGIPLLFHPFASSDISYFTASFSLEHIREEDIFWVSCLAAVLGISDTKNYSYAELNNEINIYTSGLAFSPKVYKQHRDPQAYVPRFQVSSSAMGDYYGKMLELMEETMFRTEFNDQRRLREILMMMRSGMESGFDYRGHELVMRRVASFFSQGSRYQEELHGVAFFDRLNELLNDFDARAEEAGAKLRELAKTIFTRHNLVLSLTGEEQRREELLAGAEGFLEAIPLGEGTAPAQVRFDLTKRREGLTSASGVQYVAKGYNLKTLGYDYTGQFAVLSQILSMDYLHNAIRARGGAYGAGVSIEPTGNVVAYSYRDPNLEATLEAYDGMAKFLSDLTLEEEDIKNYIIGSMTRFDSPLAAASINSMVLARRFSGSTEADIEKRMHQAMATKRGDIMASAQMMAKLMAEGYLAVFGNEDKIKAAGELFSEIRPILRKDQA